jgi:hypothetical protein
MLVLIPKGPDSGVLNHESSPLAANADSAVPLDGVFAFGFVEGKGAFRLFGDWSGEP